MTTGYIDMAAMNSALAILEQGRGSTESKWHWNNLIEVTYFLMWNKIKVAPGTGRPGPASGSYEYVIRNFPWLTSPPDHQERAKQETKDWLTNNKEQLRKAFEESTNDRDFLDWVEFQRDTFWVRHSSVYGAICEEEWVPNIAEALNIGEKEVLSIRRESQDPEVVKKWLNSRKQSSVPGVAAMAEDIWVVGGMIRGKYHESITANQGVQLLQHQFRRGIQRKLPEGELQPVYTSEELFTKLIVACALDVTSREGRVETWARYTRSARDILNDDPDIVREAKTEGDLDLILRSAAERAKLQIESKTTSRIFKSLLKWKVPSLVGYSISHWVPGAGQVGSTIERVAASVEKDKGSKEKYKAIQKAKSIPGRIERSFSKVQ